MNSTNIRILLHKCPHVNYIKLFEVFLLTYINHHHARKKKKKVENWVKLEPVLH